MKINLALAQINTRLGDVEANLEKHLALVKEARGRGADLLVFPELSLTGYVLQDLVPTVAHSATADDPIFRHLLEASHELDLSVGFVEEDSATGFSSPRLTFRRDRWCTCTKKCTCLRMACSMKAASLPGATRSVHSIPASDG